MKKLKLNIKPPHFFGGGGTLCQRKTKETESVKKAPTGEKYEHCIMCGQLTDVPVSLPIEHRENYLVGLGQLCERCSLELKRESNVIY